MTLLPHHRTMLIAWAALVGYLFALHSWAGVVYYSRLPIAESAAAPISLAVTREDTKPPIQPFTKVVPPAPARSDSLDTAPLVTPPSSTYLDAEPLPTRLRRRLLVLVPISNDLLKASKEEEAAVPLRSALGHVRDQLADDLAGQTIFVVSRDSVCTSWNLGPFPPALPPFESHDYDTAIAAAWSAFGKLLAPERRDKYDVLLIWYSHSQPDEARRIVEMPSELADHHYLLWAGFESHNGSTVLENLFPERLWPLRKEDQNARLAGLIQSQLGKANLPPPLDLP